MPQSTYDYVIRSMTLAFSSAVLSSSSDTDCQLVLIEFT
jgi:hypothetical protein